jgi:hypothetical protein
MKQYRVLVKDSEKMRIWWHPTDLTDGWFPYQDETPYKETALEEMAWRVKDFPEEEFKIQERDIIVTDWKDEDVAI